MPLSLQPSRHPHRAHHAHLLCSITLFSSSPKVSEVRRGGGNDPNGIERKKSRDEQKMIFDSDKEKGEERKPVGV